MKYSFWISGIFAALLFVLAACNRTNPEQDQAKEDMRDMPEAQMDSLQAEKDNLKKDMEAMLEKIDQKLEVLESDLKTASGKAKTEIQVQINKWEGTRKELAEDLERFNDNVGDSWRDFKVKTRAKLDEWNQELKETFGNEPKEPY